MAKIGYQGAGEGTAYHEICWKPLHREENTQATTPGVKQPQERIATEYVRAPPRRDLDYMNPLYSIPSRGGGGVWKNAGYGLATNPPLEGNPL